jgi:anti-sigma-K factor RskA
MNQFDPELFEAELRELKPSRAPSEFIEKLEERLCPSTTQLPPRANPPSPKVIHIPNIWRWLVPASALAAAVVAILLLRAPTQSARPQQTQTSVAPATPALEADNVEMAQQLVASFDAVGHLASGEPVRFRCREWIDEINLKDSQQGVAVQQRTPRLEIVSINFETY